MGIEKLEASMEDMKTISASQETRIALIEEKCKRFRSEIPSTLVEDLALMKAQLKNYQRFLWIVASGVVGIALKMIMETM